MATTAEERAADDACAAHVTRLSAGDWLAAATITPQVVTLYTERERQGVHIPSSASTRAPEGSVAIARGGTLEAFVNELDAFAAAARGQARENAGAAMQGQTLTYHTSNGETVTIPAPSYSLGEVAVAQALYRSTAADGKIERVNAAGSESAL